MNRAREILDWFEYHKGNNMTTKKQIFIIKKCLIASLQGFCIGFGLGLILSELSLSSGVIIGATFAAAGYWAQLHEELKK